MPAMCSQCAVEDGVGARDGAPGDQRDGAVHRLRELTQQRAQLVAGDDMFGMRGEVHKRAVEIEKERVRAQVEWRRRAW